MIAPDPCCVCGERMRVEEQHRIILWRCLSCGLVTVPPERIQPWRG